MAVVLMARPGRVPRGAARSPAQATFAAQAVAPALAPGSAGRRERPRASCRPDILVLPLAPGRRDARQQRQAEEEGLGADAAEVVLLPYRIDQAVGIDDDVNRTVLRFTTPWSPTRQERPAPGSFDDRRRLISEMAAQAQVVAPDGTAAAAAMFIEVTRR